MGKKAKTSATNRNNTKRPFTYHYKNPVSAVFSLAEALPERTCIVEPRGNMVRNYNYSEFAEIIGKIAHAISLTRHRTAKPIGIVTRSSFRAIAAHMGALLGGAQVIIIPVNSAIEDQIDIISNNQIELLIIDDQHSSHELIEQIPFLPQLRQLWALSDEPEKYHLEVSTLGWFDILSQSEEKRPRTDNLLAALDSNSKTSRYYSRNEMGAFQYHEYSLHELAKETQELQKQMEKKFPNFQNIHRMLSVVPFNRVGGHIEGIYLPLLSGRVMMAVDRNEAWKSNALPFAAQAIVGSSLFLNNVAEQLQESITENGGLSHLSLQANLKRLKKKFKNAKETKFDGGGMINFVLSKTVNCLVARKLKERLGGDIKLCLSIDEGLNDKSRLLYSSIGLPVREYVAKNDSSIAKMQHEQMLYNELRGAQLAENEELKHFQIIG